MGGLLSDLISYIKTVDQLWPLARELVFLVRNSRFVSVSTTGVLHGTFFFYLGIDFVAIPLFADEIELQI